MKTGDKFYRIINHTIIGYEYVSVHPHSSSYHIVLKDGAYPERLTTKELEDTISSYDDAKLRLIAVLEEEIIFWKDTFKTKK